MPRPAAGQCGGPLPSGVTLIWNKSVSPVASYRSSGSLLQNWPIPLLVCHVILCCMDCLWSLRRSRTSLFQPMGEHQALACMSPCSQNWSEGRFCQVIPIAQPCSLAQQVLP